MAEMREFESGATRASDNGKLDFEGFLSPLALERYARYMHKHRRDSKGALRASDNWQRGIPSDAYMKSLWRHFMDVWKIHRRCKRASAWKFQDALCALLFNGHGMLHESVKGIHEARERVRVARHTFNEVFTKKGKKHAKAR